MCIPIFCMLLCAQLANELDCVRFHSNCVYKIYLVSKKRKARGKIQGLTMIGLKLEFSVARRWLSFYQ